MEYTGRKKALYRGAQSVIPALLTNSIFVYTFSNAYCFMQRIFTKFLFTIMFCKSYRIYVVHPKSK